MTQRRADRPITLISSRARFLAPAAIASAMLVRRGITVSAQATATPDSLLESAIVAMSELDSFAFHLTTHGGETLFMEGISLNEVTGSVERPNRFTATAEVSLIIATIELTMISADGRLWFTDPFGAAGSWQEIPLSDFADVDPTVVINPDRLLIPALSIIENPTVLGEEELEPGVVATRIDGTVDLSTVTGITGTPAAGEFGFSLPDQMPFSVWIDGESLVRRIEVSGPILPLESDSIVRRVDIFGFNEPVDIQPPS